jgi:multiple sugar transport system substrate-binding protein
MAKRSLSRRNFLKLGAGALGSLLAAGLPGVALAQEAVEADVGDLSYEGDLTFWDWSFDARTEYMNTLLDNWMSANGGVNIDYTTYGYSDLQTRLLTSSDAATNPPLSNVHVNWRYPLQKSGALAPLPEDLFDYDQLISTDFNRDPETGDIFTTTFGYYGDVVFYNRDILDEAGIAPEDIPNNWEDFLALARELTIRDERGFVTRPGAALNHYFSQEWLWHSMVYQQDEFLYNEAGDQALWDSDAGVQALELIRAWYNDDPIDDYQLLRHFEQFANGDAAMFISHGYWSDTLRVDYPDLNWGAVPIPTFTGDAAPAWGMALPEEGLAVFANATDEQQAAAFDFIQYVLQPEAHRLSWGEVMTGPPDSEALLDADTIEGIDTNNVINSVATTLPYRVIYGERPLEAEQLWRTMFEEVIINNTPAADALATATEEMNTIFEETGPRLITEQNYAPPEDASDSE